MFQKIYKNKNITLKYYKKYVLLNNFSSNYFKIPKVFRLENNKIYFENIKNNIPLNKLDINKINFEIIWKNLNEIHSFFQDNKINNKQYIHWDFCLQNILKTNNNQYYIIDFESPKEYENTEKYIFNDPYLDLWIFIIKLITSKPIYISFFINYNKNINNFLKWYNKNINKKLLSKYINIEIDRFLNWVKSKSKVRYILWKLYLIIKKYA